MNLFDVTRPNDLQTAINARVVAMWRSLGLTCFQVADGDF